MMKEKDSELFQTEVGDVKPLAKNGRVLLHDQRQDTLGQQARRMAAQGVSEQAFVAPLSLQQVAAVAPNAVLSFQRPGVQHGVFRKLRLGQYQIEARLDLHQMTVAQARQALLQFIGDSLRYDVRCALITHGKGEGRPQPAKLKSCIASWLPQLEEVLAFHSAQPYHGGSGATYVLIKKSAASRQANWERHIGRRG